MNILHRIGIALECVKELESESEGILGFYSSNPTSTGGRNDRNYGSFLRRRHRNRQIR